MAVVNIAFDLEPEIMEGLATGAYKLFGGVVRDQAGHIVRHLPEALSIAEASEAPAKAVASATKATTKVVAKNPAAGKAVTATAKKAPSLFRTIGQFAKAHPIGTGIAVVAVVAGAGYGIYRWCKDRNEKKAEAEKAPAYIQHFNASLDLYYNAIQTGSLNENIVADLISAIEDMRNAIASGTVKIEFTATQFNNMLGVLSYFTREFAAANSFDYTEPATSEQNDACSNLLRIEDYLKIQQKIYQAA